jgi:hypothetical protein
VLLNFVQDSHDSTANMHTFLFPIFLFVLAVWDLLKKCINQLYLMPPPLLVSIHISPLNSNLADHIDLAPSLLVYSNVLN